MNGKVFKVKEQEKRILLMARLFYSQTLDWKMEVQFHYGPI